MHRKFTRVVTVTKSVTKDGTTTTEKTETKTEGGPEGAEPDRMAAEAEKLFAETDKMFEQSAGLLSGFSNLFGSPFLWSAKKSKPAEPKKEDPKPAAPPPAPDFLSSAPGSAVIADLGTLNVFRYRGRYYAWSSREVTKPVGYYALDTLRPAEGQS